MNLWGWLVLLLNEEIGNLKLGAVMRVMASYQRALQKTADISTSILVVGPPADRGLAGHVESFVSVILPNIPDLLSYLDTEYFRAIETALSARLNSILPISSQKWQGEMGEVRFVKTCNRDMDIPRDYQLYFSQNDEFSGDLGMGLPSDVIGRQVIAATHCGNVFESTVEAVYAGDRNCGLVIHPILVGNKLITSLEHGEYSQCWMLTGLNPEEDDRITVTCRARDCGVAMSLSLE